MIEAFSKVFTREIERLKKRKYIVFITVFLPIILCFIICKVFEAGSPRNLPIALLDNDNSNISRIYARMLESSPTLNITERPLNLEEAKKLLREKKVYAFVVVPKDFKEDIYKNKTPKIVSYYNNQTMLIGGMVSKELLTCTKTLASGIKLNGKLKKGEPRELAMTKISPINIVDYIKSNPYLNYIYFLGLISFIHTYQVIICLVSIWTLGIELKEGTAKEWLQEADNSIIVAILGKLAPYFLTLLISILVTYLMYFGLYSVPLNGDVVFIILSTIIFILSYQLIGLIYVALTANLRLALSCGAFYTALGFTFAGVTFPIIGMPKFAEVYAQLLPITHYIKILINQVPRGFPVEYDIHSFLYLLCFCVLGIACIPRLKKLALDESKWYKI